MGHWTQCPAIEHPAKSRRYLTVILSLAAIDGEESDYHQVVTVFPAQRRQFFDAQGNLIGYVPLAQFDLENSITGPDPQNPFSYLGDDTGLRHTYVDVNVKNGITYSYTIVAYDRGDSLIYSLESARGTGTADRNFITVTPRPDYSGLIPADVDSLDHVQGNGKGRIIIGIIDDDILTSDEYQISFSGDPAASFELLNSTTDEILLTNMPVNFQDNPVVDGFQITVDSDQKIGGIKSVTDGYGVDVFGEGAQDSSHSWIVSISEFPLSTPESRTHDYEIRFTEAGAVAYSWGPANISTAAFPVNFEVWDVTMGVNEKICLQVKDDNGNQRWDEGESIFIVSASYPEPQIGDSLNAIFPDDFAYILIINNSSEDTLNIPPQIGDIVRIESYRSLRSDDVFSFHFDLPGFDPNSVDLSQVRVVPNPYIVAAQWEEIQNVRQIRFMFLPPVCTINIYTLSGEKVYSIHHDNFTGDEAWNVLSESNQALAFGIYLYVVTTPEGQKHVGKFGLIK